MKAIVHALALTLTTVLLSFSAYAQQGSPPPGYGGARTACRDDAKNFCKGVQPGGGRILDCLKDHYKEISDSCYQALQTMAAHGGPDGSHSGPGAPGGGPPHGNNQDGPPGPPPPPSDDEDDDAPDQKPAQ